LLISALPDLAIPGARDPTEALVQYLRGVSAHL
jgi:hypothetical protein